MIAEKANADRELDRLIDRMCDQIASVDELAALGHRLADDPVARDYYIACLELHARLAWQMTPGKPFSPEELLRYAGGDEGRVASGEWRGMAGSPASDGEEGFGVRDSGFGVRDSESLSAGTAVELPHQPESRAPNPESPVFPFPSLSPLPSPLSPDFVGSWAFACMVSAVFMCVMLLVLWAIKIPHHQHIAEAPSKSVPSIKRPEFVFVGRITGMVDVKWSDATTAAVTPSVPLGRKYALASGLMEITYDTGAKVILQGPCTYEVESTAGGYLALGKLTARVGAVKGKGSRSKVQGSRPSLHPSSFILHPSSLFSVRTPTAVVTDLGTEFGVEVDRSGVTESHVFCGSVKVAVLDADGNLPSPSGRGAGGEGSGHEVILRENESARVERADGIGQPSIIRHAVESVPSGFVRAMPPPKHVAGSTGYAELVLSLNPAVYYRMERPKDEKDRLVVFDSAPGGHHGVLYLADEYCGSPYWSGRFGDSLHLRGQGAGDHAIVPDYPKAANDQLTVSAWVMLDSQSMWCAMIAANWGNASTPERPAHGQFHFGLCESDGDLSVQATQRDQKCLLVREGKDRPLPLGGTWLHVAFVADGTTLRLYRNGVEVATGPCRGILPRPPMASLGIGCKTTTAGMEASTRTPAFWRGRIDELAVFNRALSPAEVCKLAQSWE